MSGTITFRTILSVANGRFSDSKDTGSISITQTGLGYHSQILLVETGTQQILPTGDLINLGVGFFRNVDESGYAIEIGSTGTSWERFCTLESGQACPFLLSTGIQLAVKSIGSGTASLEYRIYER